MVLTKRYQCNDGAIYYVRENAGKVHWFGEHAGGGFANVFVGTRSGATVTGKWYDVPKGFTASAGDMTFTVSADENTLTKTSATGGFFGSNWTAIPNGPTPSHAFRKAGYEASGAADLTGTWMGNDGGTYYVRQMGSVIAWFGERKTFSNVFVGTRSGSTITGEWADVPKGSILGGGTLTLNLANGFTLDRTGATGGFGGSQWQRVSSLNVEVRLTRLRINRSEDTFGDEPFLWTMFLKADADGIHAADLRNAVVPVTSTSGSHNNITGEEGIDAIRTLTIPVAVGRFRTVLKTIRGVDPASAAARSFTRLAFLTVAFDEDGTSDGAIEAGRITAVATLQGELTNAVRSLTVPDTAAIAARIQEEAVAAVKGAEAWYNVPGWVDPDDFLGFAVSQFTFAQLQAAIGSPIPISLRFTGDEADYQVFGQVIVT